jgi:hypothetical protein
MTAVRANRSTVDACFMDSGSSAREHALHVAVQAYVLIEQRMY